MFALGKLRKDDRPCANSSQGRTVFTSSNAFTNGSNMLILKLTLKSEMVPKIGIIPPEGGDMIV